MGHLATQDRFSTSLIVLGQLGSLSYGPQGGGNEKHAVVGMAPAGEWRLHCRHDFGEIDSPSPTGIAG
jgi:hypothetical protein